MELRFNVGVSKAFQEKFIFIFNARRITQMTNPFIPSVLGIVQSSVSL